MLGIGFDDVRTVIAARKIALGLLLTGGLLAAGCRGPVATPSESTPISSVPSAATPTSSSGTIAPSTGATPRSTASGSTSPGAESTTTSGSSPSQPGADAEIYGTDLVLTDDTLEFTPMQWYFGKDALARCKKLDIEPEGAWCNDFFFEEAGDRVSAPLAEDVKIKVVTKNAELRRATRAQLNQAISESLWPHFQIRLANGEAVIITQVYTP